MIASFFRTAAHKLYRLLGSPVRLPWENTTRIAFTGWNPFQFRHIQNIAKHLPGAFFLVEDRKNGNLGAFPEAFFHNAANPVMVVKKGHLARLEDHFDVFVTQVAFPGIQQITRSRIVMLQYGYAKEPHNYGIWRALADVNITYGPYASEKISRYTPVAACGNPEADDWEDPLFHQACRERFAGLLDPAKQTVLYAPTWGDLSSVDLYLESILALRSRYNVLIKMHHNTDILEGRGEHMKTLENVHVFGANENIFSLLAVSDLMISDYSGALFDGFYCRRPLILLDIPSALESAKIDKGSLELMQRDRLGCVVSRPEDLDRLGQLAENAKSRAGGGLWDRLFAPCSGNNARKAAQVIRDAAAGRYELSRGQLKLRKTARRMDYREFK